MNYNNYEQIHTTTQTARLDCNDSMKQLGCVIGIIVGACTIPVPFLNCFIGSVAGYCVGENIEKTINIRLITTTTSKVDPITNQPVIKDVYFRPKKE